MAGSRQGWREAAYVACPCGFGELARGLTWIEPAPYRAGARPALRSGGVPDVLRGEEVQVFGAMDLLQERDGCFVLPGTHSKWVTRARGRVRIVRHLHVGRGVRAAAPALDPRAHDAAADGALDEAPSCAACARAAKRQPVRSAFSAARWPVRAAAGGTLPSYLSGW
jgi:2-dehydro-3-deoxygalactonokinase